MSEIKTKLWNGRRVKEEKKFETKDLDTGLLRAMEYASDLAMVIGGVVNGGVIGLAHIDKDGLIPKFSIRKYTSLTNSEKMMLSGVILTAPDKKAPAKVVLFESNTIL